VPQWNDVWRDQPEWRALALVLMWDALDEHQWVHQVTSTSQCAPLWYLYRVDVSLTVRSALHSTTQRCQRRRGRKQLIAAASAATSRDNDETQRSRICSWFALSTGNRICRRRRFRRRVALPSFFRSTRSPPFTTEEQQRKY